MRFTIWQCADWCCQERPHSKRYWNVSTRPGRYESFPSWRDACLATIQDPNAKSWFA